MIAVIFEVWPEPEHREDYLEVAAGLRPLLESIDGFIAVERFESLSEPGKILSLSFFESEEAIHRWRRLPEHRRAQALGRNGYFAGYRLRVAQVLRDYTGEERGEAPRDSRAMHG